jgi:hypothetical protein
MAKPRTNSTYYYPKELNGNTGEYKHRITFSALKKQVSETGTQGSHGMVALYLPPDALKTAYSQGWGDTDMGAVGNAILQNAAAQGEAKSLLTAPDLGTALAGIGKGDTKGTVSTLVNAAKQGFAQSFKKNMAAAAIGGDSAIKAIEKVRGEILNPHKAVMYTGPGGFRTFSYNFVMVARSSTEADEIAKIVHFFKYHMHPGLGSTDTVETVVAGKTHTTGGEQATNIGSSLTLTYPAEWEIQIRVNQRDTDSMGYNTDNPIMFKIDKCFLESCNVDYATGGNPSFFMEGNKPQTTTMALQFKETSIMTKEMIERGY